MKACLVGIPVCLVALFSAGLRGQQLTQGSLRAVNGQGAPLADCPLKHTTVKAEISGMVARVNVVQDFQNTLPDTIEAVYTFPLPHDAAVDSMTMHIGGRTIEGRIKRREEARALYNAAREAGHVAGLLDQHRPNIFSQSVANVPPGEKVRVAISYVQVLQYAGGQYEFVFPMVVAPPYIPAGVDGSHITPPIVPKGTRAGHDISVEVAIDGGLPIGDVGSKTHDVDVQWYSAQKAAVRLRDENTVPNKDFIVRYRSASQTMQDAVLAHHSARGGFFTLILQPPEKAGPADAMPKELVFVLDTSGSMMGFPIEKAKESMQMALEGLYPQDTFNLITFSGDTDVLFPEAVAPTPENRQMAKLFLQSRSGNGGTEMMKAIRAALEPTVGRGRVRIVCFMTDGEVGNDMEILAEVRAHPETPVFAFGIGQSVNRFLLDGMARLGRGEVEYVGLQDDGSAAARRFYERVRNPLLTGLAIDWGGLPVTDVYPKALPDLFDAKPVVVMGRYTGAARGTANLHGNVGGREVSRKVALDLPAAESGHDVLATLWARARIEDLMMQDYGGAQRGSMRADLQQQVTQIALDYKLASQFTSFVAVEEQVVSSNGKSRRVEVPVNLPEGMSYEGLGRVRIGGNVGGVAGGVLGGIIGGVPSAAAPPRRLLPRPGGK
jgi:Ca-activated chloride channel homolog